MDVNYDINYEYDEDDEVSSVLTPWNACNLDGKTKCADTKALLL